MSFSNKFFSERCSFNSGYISKEALKEKLNHIIISLQKTNKDKYLYIYFLPVILNNTEQTPQIKDSKDSGIVENYKKYLTTIKEFKGKVITLYYNVRYRPYGSICILLEFCYNTKTKEFCTRPKHPAKRRV